MNYLRKQPLLKNTYKSARTSRGPGLSPASTLATMASLGLSLTYLVTNRKKLLQSVQQKVKKQNPTELNDQSSTTKNTYFEAAPRAISGSHRGISEYAHTNSGMIRKGGQFALGSAALLSIIYLVRKRK